MHKSSSMLLIGCVCALAGAQAATTWYWSPKVKSCRSSTSTTLCYQWTTPSNWVTSAGETSRGTGYPKTGDTAVLGESGKDETYAPNGDSQFLYELRIGPKGAVNSNQGTYGLQGGGQGLQYLCGSNLHGNWSAMKFGGTGEVPINIASNGVHFCMQNGMLVASGSKTVAVKVGKGKFVCFNEGATTYQIPLVLIREGTWDMSTKGTYSNVRIAFDGNDGSQRLQFGYAAGWGTDLVLNNAELFETNGVANAEHGISDTSRGYQVAFTGTPKANPLVFSGRFYDSAGLRWSPASDAYTFVCSNAVSGTTGKVTVTKGTVKLVTGASFTNLAELAVSAGATFSVDAASGKDFFAASLVVGDATAKLALAEGVALHVTGATVNGKAISPGTYTAAGGGDAKQAAWIEGAGSVVVAEGPAASFTWQGGAAGGDSVYLAGNWTDGGDPDLASGELLATFAEAGSTAAIPAGQTPAFAGLILDNTTGASAFSFTAGAGASATVGANGLQASSDAATTWTMGWPLVFAGDQSLTVGANDTLDLAGGFSGTDALTVDAAGTLVLSAASDHAGALTLQTGTVRAIASRALGADGRTVSFDFNKTTLQLGGAQTVLGTPLRGVTSGLDTSTQGLTVEAGAHVTCERNVSLVGDHMLRLGAGSTLVLQGGYTCTSTSMNGRMYARGSGTVVVTNGTLSIPFQISCAKDNPVNFEFWSAGNVLNASRLYNWSTFGARLTTRVPNAFRSNTWIQLLYGTTVFDLAGNDQLIGWFHGSLAGSCVTSAVPATLTLASAASSEYSDNTGAGDQNRIDLATFAGAVSVVKKGALPHTFGVASTTTGSLAVEQGEVIFTASGSWTNASAVRVKGGTLTLRNAAAFGEKTVWHVASAATVNLDNAGTNRTDRLFVDEARAPGGLYAAADFAGAADFRPAWLSGTGCLFVKTFGTALILR